MTTLYVFDLDGNTHGWWQRHDLERIFDWEGLVNDPSFLNEERRLMTLYVQRDS